MQKMYGKAFAFALAGIQISRPDDTLFVAQDIYDWRLLDELGVAAYWVAEYAACKAACEAVLQRVEQGLDVPADDLHRVRQNLAFCEGKLAQR